MTDLEQRIREAIEASVARAEPNGNVMDEVRRRHHRHLIWTAAAASAIAASVVAVVLVVLAGALPGGRPSPAATKTKPVPPGRNVPVFPGGGRLLFADRHGLKWLYPDGRAVRIARGFTGGAVAGDRLLAWNRTGAYLMTLDGSQRRQVLSFGSAAQMSVILGGGMSPDGSRLAYYAGKCPGRCELWVIDLASERRVDIGRVYFDQWRDDATILASPERSASNALLLVNARTARRSVYLRPVSDPVLVHAYEHARPGAGPPAVMTAGGFSGTGPAPAFAVALGAAGPFMGRQPAELVLLGGRRVASYRPATPQQFEFDWGPDGLFLITTGAGDNPASWNTYVGSISSDRLSPPIQYGMNGAAFSPGGNVIALKDGNQVTFVPVPQPSCQGVGQCVTFEPQHLTGKGTLLAWTR
jgi:hypothetical protein